jgi:Arc/MetJ-type ribon-helix-helix transcriptional regulator
MQTVRITIRLPKICIDQIDLFLKTGDYLNRSEVIRHAISEFLGNHADHLIEKNKKLREVSKYGQYAEALEPYMTK